MPTTTIRLPDDLKRRVKRAAEHSGTTAHNFILAAISEKADQDALRADFDELAQQRYAKVLASGKTIAWNEMRSYLLARAEGKKPAHPAARKLAR